jgi:hypothetical protein
MDITRAPRVVTAALVGTALILASAEAVSAPVVGAPIIVQHDGPVVATFVGHSASFVDELFLQSPSGVFAGVIFNNHTTPVGTTINLGTFSAGTELIFRLHVNNTGLDFFTGNASRNPDGEAHARIDASFGPDTTLVGFEDLHASVSDHDFNDLIYSFTNTGIVPSIPEPSTYLVLLTALGLTAVGRRVLGSKKGLHGLG